MRYVWHMVVVGLCVVVSAFRADAAPLTQADVETVMAVRTMADAFRDEALTRGSAERSGRKALFMEVMVKVHRIGQEADERACRHHGVGVSEYRQRLRRAAKVGELVMLETTRVEMQEELERLQSMSDEDLKEEAKRQLASTEQWFDQIKSGTPSNATSDVGSPVASADAAAGAKDQGYADSLEEIVMKPMREQAVSGEWDEVVRRANEKRVEELRQQIRQIGKKLLSRAMRLAATDKEAVLAVVDVKTLQGLETSLVGDLPVLPARK